MKTILTILVIFGLINSDLTAQSDELTVNLDASKYEVPSFYLLRGNNILVHYPSVGRTPEKNLQYKRGLICYDFNLKELWRVDDFCDVTLTKKEYKTYPKEYNDYESLNYRTWPVNITSDDYYIYAYNKAGKLFNIVNTLTGEKTEITLPEQFFPKVHLKYSAFVEDNVVYFIGRKQNHMTYVTRTEERQVMVFTYDLKTSESNVSEFEITSIGESKDLWDNSAAQLRDWIAEAMIDSVVYFVDNFTIIDKDSKGTFKRVVGYTTKGELVFDKYIQIGAKHADKDMLGDIAINPFSEGMTYTYMMEKEGGNVKLHYYIYNSKMELVWDNAYESDIKLGTIQRTIGSAILSSDCNGVKTIYSSYGDDIEFVLTINSEGEKTFNTYNDGACSKIPFDYSISCDEYNLLSSNAKAQTFVNKEMTKEGKVDAYVFKCDDKLLVIETPTLWGYKLSEAYVSFYLFK